MLQFHRGDPTSPLQSLLPDLVLSCSGGCCIPTLMGMYYGLAQPCVPPAPGFISASEWQVMLLSPAQVSHVGSLPWSEPNTPSALAPAPPPNHSVSAPLPTYRCSSWVHGGLQKSFLHGQRCPESFLYSNVSPVHFPWTICSSAPPCSQGVMSLLAMPHSPHIFKNKKNK